mgnify:CR=1 FL=1
MEKTQKPSAKNFLASNWVWDQTAGGNWPFPPAHSLVLLAMSDITKMQPDKCFIYWAGNKFLSKKTNIKEGRIRQIIGDLLKAQFLIQTRKSSPQKPAEYLLDINRVTCSYSEHVKGCTCSNSEHVTCSSGEHDTIYNNKQETNTNSAKPQSSPPLACKSAVEHFDRCYNDKLTQFDDGFIDRKIVEYFVSNFIEPKMAGSYFREWANLTGSCPSTSLLKELYERATNAQHPSTNPLGAGFPSLHLQYLAQIHEKKPIIHFDKYLLGGPNPLIEQDLSDQKVYKI